MFDANTKVTYTQVTFTREPSDKPLPISRSNTKYSSIVYPPSTTSRTASTTSPDSNLPPPPPPTHTSRGANTKNHQQFVDSDSPTGDGALYDTPPPPVPIRVLPENDPWSPIDNGEPSNSQHDNRLANPFVDTGKPTDPFSEDPFASSAEEWNDPAAFYDRPPPPRPLPAAVSNIPPAAVHPGASRTNDSSNVHAEEKEAKEPSQEEVVEDNSADFTGSAYEDATEFLIAARRATLQRKAEERHQTNQSDLFAPAAEVYHGEDREQKGMDDVSAQYDVPTGDFDHAPSDGKQQDVDEAGSSYEYPSALSLYPSRKDGIETGSQEEPALHVMNYSKSSPALVRNVGAVDSRHSSSRHMPLPPLPTNHPPGRVPAWSQSDNPPPPLPARPPSIKSRDGRGSGGGNQTQHPPPLPPMNISRTGRQQQHAGTPTPVHEDHPPLPPTLPPRKKPNGSHPSPPPAPDSPPTAIRGVSTAREDGIMELVSLGYSRSDVVRAMAISKNDSQLALLILKEFGGR